MQYVTYAKVFKCMHWQRINLLIQFPGAKIKRKKDKRTIWRPFHQQCYTLVERCTAKQLRVNSKRNQLIKRNFPMPISVRCRKGVCHIWTALKHSQRGELLVAFQLRRKPRTTAMYSDIVVSIHSTCILRKLETFSLLSQICRKKFSEKPDNMRIPLC